MKIFINILIIISIIAGLTGCPTSKMNKEAAWKEEIINADKEFSKLSAEKGMKRAFLEYIDDHGILLRPNQLPIVGADAIEFLTQQNDSSYTLTWHPSAADVSSAGDLGYTYGIYNLQLQDTTLNGTYVSIWKKDATGKWKFVLDTGNEGIGDVKNK